MKTLLRASRDIVGLAAIAAAGLSACGNATSGPQPARADIAAAAADPVTVSPLPGTPDASPTTQISFLAEAPATVSAVRVVGSRSGEHGGVLRPYSTGTGESFLPTHPFAAGERVRVSARVLSAGRTVLARTSFTVAHQASVSQTEFPINPGDPSEVQHYSTAPALTPSTVTVTTAGKPGASPGYLFLAPYQGKGTAGPMIAEQDGALVWFDPLPSGVEATNFQVQHYQGQPVLSWWQGRILRVGFGEGEYVLDDSSYQRVASVRAGNGYRADLHEMRLTPEGTAWIDAFDPIYMNLSSAHGSADGVISDSIIQEIDVKTGLVMWEWHALGHIPIGESKNATPSGHYPWDYIHINSIDPGSHGDVLLSARNTWTIYDVNIHSGGFVWSIGGSHSPFRLGRGVRFYWQHDVEFQPGGLISVFDNGSDPPKEKQSRGLLLAPDFATHTVRLLKQFTNPSKVLLAESQGNALSLPGGNWLLGYGRLPNFTEFNSQGQVLLDGTLGRNVQDFRTYLSPWSGRAPGSPAILAQPAAGGAVAVSASWNGATEVASWRVLAGSSAATLSAVATAPRSGFQTTLDIPARFSFVAVQALDGSGAVLGSSATVAAPGPG